MGGAWGGRLLPLKQDYVQDYVHGCCYSLGSTPRGCGAAVERVVLLRTPATCSARVVLAWVILPQYYSIAVG